MSICVLTGDIVGSTDLPAAQRRQVMAILEDTYGLIARDGAGFFDTYRGDGWQMAFDRPALALRLALFIRASLKEAADTFETRVAMATGDGIISSLDLQSAPFIASGRALDAMPRDVLFAHADGGALHGAALLADHISQGWTQAQARAIRPFLHPAATVTQKDVAEATGVTRQAIGQALEAAGYGPISKALSAIEEQAE
ncbi:hypothetical protein DC363_12530 [Thalassorhabdomicrobium marinisediminis]|uniref:Uncharacterized protein n=2 Tax=Thalassorhabdomicrobium marinisediminis TaxID=2170577 RepID=A0A2T7FVH3_9RHOB|nr:hypothetical protein DC363_12530 [Thalassorhabdomicrobium marinisediminis]